MSRSFWNWLPVLVQSLRPWLLRQESQFHQTSLYVLLDALQAIEYSKRWVMSIFCLGWLYHGLRFLNWWFLFLFSHHTQHKHMWEERATSNNIGHLYVTGGGWSLVSYAFTTVPCVLGLNSPCGLWDPTVRTGTSQIHATAFWQAITGKGTQSHLPRVTTKKVAHGVWWL